MSAASCKLPFEGVSSRGITPLLQGYKHMGFTTAEDGTITYREWLPAAQAVSLIGDFNGWDGGRHSMDRGEGGVWSITLPAGSIPHCSRVKLHALKVSCAVAARSATGYEWDRRLTLRTDSPLQLRLRAWVGAKFGVRIKRNSSSSAPRALSKGPACRCAILEPPYFQSPESVYETYRAQPRPRFLSPCFTHEPTTRCQQRDAVVAIRPAHNTPVLCCLPTYRPTASCRAGVGSNLLSSWWCSSCSGRAGVGSTMLLPRCCNAG